MKKLHQINKMSGYIKSFKTYLEEKINPVYIIFGRFNPPTTGHEKAFKKLESIAKGNDFKIYASHTTNNKTDPLSYDDKIKFLRKMFPKYGRNIILDKKAKTILIVASQLYDAGYTQLNVVVGSDRVSEFKSLLTKYNNIKGTHGYYNFNDGIKIINAGNRDSADSGVTGMSASKLRAAASDNDLQTFSSGMPGGFKDTKELFNAVRKGLGLRESYNFRKHIELNNDEMRQSYLLGEIYKVGDNIIDKKTLIEYTIISRGSNYVDCHEMDNPENKKRLFIHNITESSKYYSGLSKSTSAKRAAHFNKAAKKDENDPSAYEPAPGDARAKTKPSQYTIAYAKKFGDKNENLNESNPTAALQKKSEESGIAYSILKDVFDRGVAAWRTGHRPGTTPAQWGLARVNSFIVGGKTQKTTDADLWAKHTGKNLKEEAWEDGYKRRVVQVTDKDKLEAGFKWRIKGKERDEITIKYYKKKPDFDEFTRQMKRVAGHEFGR